MSSLDESPECFASTFRDPQGRLLQSGDRVLREIYAEWADEVIAWVQSPLAQKWISERRLIASQVLESSPLDHLKPGSVCLDHERVHFPSYPWEWAPGQWKAAGELTLDLCEEAVEHGLILKDATPLNVLFVGSSPIFVDVLSFEKRDKGSPIWIAYGQFVRTFLLPLAAYARLGWPLSASQQRRDGYEPADLSPWLGPISRWKSPMRALVTAPLLLERRLAKKEGNVSYRPKFSDDLAEQTLRSTLRKARKTLESIASPQFSSRWSDYVETAAHYSSADHAAKQAFVREKLKQIRPGHVLDVGANTGTYSRIAAEAGASVVAWDTDVRATGESWRKAHQDKLSILPLVADFARPTPAVGWRNQECNGLLARARQRFDCVLMLGVLHHLLVADRIPLDSVIEQLVEITRKWAILEWIPKDDSQFVGLCRGREGLYVQLDLKFFELSIGKRFVVLDRERLPNGRTLFLMERTS